MKRVVRLVSALGAGASLVWGLAKSVRRGRKSETPKPAPTWPPTPEPKAEPVEAKPKQDPVAPKAEEPERATPVEPDAEELVLKGVVVEDPAKLLAFVNDTPEAALLEAGIKGKALAVVMDNRPFPSATTIGETKGIGRRTLQTLCAAAES